MSMRSTIRRSAAVAAFALAMTGVAAAPAAAAEIDCDSFTSLRHAGTGYYTHVPSLGSGSGNFNCVLAKGSRNIGVKALQESLNHCFGRSLAPDGQFGTLTEAAVRYAQGQLGGLSVDGRYGPRTSAAFRFALYDHNNGGRLVTGLPCVGR